MEVNCKPGYHLSLLLIVSLLLFVACAKKEKDIPSLDRTQTVEGIDENNNDVRDDIEKIIQSYSLNDEQKNALIQYAIALQNALLLSSTRDNAYENLMDLYRAKKCLASKIQNYIQYTDEIHAFTINTEARINAYINIEELTAGAAFPGIVGDPCLEQQPSFQKMSYARSYEKAIQNSVCETGGYVIGYFNGIKNTSEDPLTRLEALYTNRYADQNIKYVFFKNPSNWYLKDTLEAFKQKIDEIDWLKGHYELYWMLQKVGVNAVIKALKYLNPMYFLFPGRTEQFIQKFQDLADGFIEKEKEITEDIYSKIGDDYRPVVDDMVAKITPLITEQRKILIIAHSQGNLFANAVYNRIEPTLSNECLKIVHVAPASGDLNGPYTLADIDLIINALLNVPDANVELPLSALTDDDPTGHGFLEIYMNEEYQAYDKIKSDMDYALDTLETPATTGNSGFFTLTLTWDGYGDVDLHVFEPDGTHVYYSNKLGMVGYLDVDNIVGEGPEHYFASCDSTVLQEGVYSIGINNYYNATGRMATVQLSTIGHIYDPVTLSVGPELGSSGNVSPIHVFNVRVQQNEDGIFVATQE